VSAAKHPANEPDPQAAFQEHMVHLVRSLGLHKPDETPCGQPISVGEAHALLEIARETGMTQNGLAARLRLEKSTVSRIAGMLEARGWIKRERDEHDARFIRLRLTAQGLKANANIGKSRAAKFGRIFAAIPANQRDAVLASLSLLLEVTDET
jgi:DNA-binding MarR family transcriptional regulator